MGCCAVADHDELAFAKFFHRFLDFRALVVGVYTRRYVSVQVAACESWSVAVYLFVMGLGAGYFFQAAGVTVDDTDIIHHLGESQDTRMLVEGIDGPVVEISPCLVHRAGRDAGREHEMHVDRKTFCRLQHVFNAVGAHDICNLVRICYDCGRAVGQDSFGEFIR